LKVSPPNSFKSNYETTRSCVIILSPHEAEQAPPRFSSDVCDRRNQLLDFTRSAPWLDADRPSHQEGDPITAIEFTDYESGFVAGVDFLAGGLLVAFAIFTLSLAAAKLERNKWL
jgi:hypothetical protein